MDDKITIIEGPPPVFENIDEGWVLGLNESPSFYDMALTRLRTFNGPALVERCHRAWNQKEPIFLHYRDEMGMEEEGAHPGCAGERSGRRAGALPVDPPPGRRMTEEDGFKINT